MRIHRVDCLLIKAEALSIDPAVFKILVHHGAVIKGRFRFGHKFFGRILGDRRDFLKGPIPGVPLFVQGFNGAVLLLERPSETVHSRRQLLPAPIAHLVTGNVSERVKGQVFLSQIHGFFLSLFQYSRACVDWAASFTPCTGKRLDIGHFEAIKRAFLPPLCIKSQTCQYAGQHPLLARIRPRMGPAHKGKTVPVMADGCQTTHSYIHALAMNLQLCPYLNQCGWDKRYVKSYLSAGLAFGDLHLLVQHQTIKVVQDGEDHRSFFRQDVGE